MPLKSSLTSMIPLIYPQDKLFISKLKNPQFEDIVIFKQKNILKAHRVLHISNDYLITKGDNNKKADNKIGKTQILGLVNQIKRDGEELTLNHIYFSQSAKYFQIITQLTKKLQKNNIDYVFLKGLPIHLKYKNSPPKHLYFDLDILIQKSDLKKVEKIILAMGFKKPPPSPFLSSKQPTQYNHYKPDLPTNIVIDLHTEPGFGFTKSTHINSLLPDPEKLTNYFLKNSDTQKISGENISILKPKAQIILLFLHFFHHNFKLIHKLHIIKYINKHKLSWKKVFIDTNELKLIPFINPSILLFDHYYPNIIPSEYVQKTKTLKNTALFHIHKKGVFNIQFQNLAGIHRLLLIIFLSEEPIRKKAKILFSKKTAKNIYKVTKSLLPNSLKNSSKSSFA